MLQEKLYTFLHKLGDYSKILLVLMVIFFSISLYRNYSKVKSSSERIEAARERVEQLKRENDTLKQDLKEKESEEFIEKELRDKLNLAKEGEIIVVLPDEEILRKLAPEREDEEEYLPDPNWKKWLKIFI
ncbi:septum formation initiator family protein [Candidatus Woesebacteria bacterium]|nr:septum formation initiator family protein [Candidatus Woesebacteria bacterium]